MKILLVSFQNPERDLNGVACHIRDLYKALIDFKVETKILSPYTKCSGIFEIGVNKTKKILNQMYKFYKSEYIFFSILYLTQIQLQNRLRLESGKYSVINVQDIISLMAVVDLQIKTPVVFTCHFLTEPWMEFSNAGFFKLESHLFKKFENRCRKAMLSTNLKFISVSNRNKNLMLQALPALKSENIFVAYLGLDLQFNEQKVEVTIPQSEYILNVGKLDRIKNQRLFLDLALSLKSIDRHVLFVIAGPEDANEKKFMQGEIQRFGLEKYFLFMGPLNRDSVYFLMKHATLYIHTAEMESFGMAIVEAMGSNLCVLVRENDAILEITDGENEGIFARSLKGQDLLNFVLPYLDSELKRKNLAEKEMQIFKRKYTLEKMRDNFMKYYSVIEDVRHE